ncbi:MAG TPA: ABC transporter permease subunit, partial [Anaerolineaceae bacterium]
MKSTRPAVFRDERILRVVGQLIFVLLLGALAWYLAGNMLANMRRQGLSLGFDFLRGTAGFDIGETLIPYSRSSTFAQAFLVGLLNTLQVSAVGIVLTTLVGFVVGVARLSRNFLVRGIARVYIEFLRNIPLLVLLIFLYIGVFIKFPRVNQAVMLPGPVYLTNRGVALPWGEPAATFPGFLLALAVGLGLAILTGVVLE